jgi:hypothetical protein
VTEAEAIEIAFSHAQKQGWTWLQPVHCQLRSRWFGNAVYVIRSSADKRGANVEVTIDAEDGTIKDARFLPR